MNKSVESIRREDMERLQRYGWPGNVRELRNVRRARDDPLLRADAADRAAERTSRRDDDAVLSMDEVQRRHILKVLEAAGGRIRGPGGAAEMLGLKAHHPAVEDAAAWARPAAAAGRTIVLLTIFRPCQSRTSTDRLPVAETTYTSPDWATDTVAIWREPLSMARVVQLVDENRAYRRETVAEMSTHPDRGRGPGPARQTKGGNDVQVNFAFRSRKTHGQDRGGPRGSRGGDRRRAGLGGAGNRVCGRGPETGKWGGAIDPDALQILKGMTDYLGSLQRFTMHTENIYEDVLETGQKIQFHFSSSIVVQRPDKLRAERVDGQATSHSSTTERRFRFTRAATTSSPQSQFRTISTTFCTLPGIRSTWSRPRATWSFQTPSSC